MCTFHSIASKTGCLATFQRGEKANSVLERIVWTIHYYGEYFLLDSGIKDGLSVATISVSRLGALESRILASDPFTDQRYSADHCRFSFPWDKCCRHTVSFIRHSVDSANQPLPKPFDCCQRVPSPSTTTALPPNFSTSASRTSVLIPSLTCPSHIPPTGKMRI